MIERAERLWRVLATGFCFVCFGIGGLVLSLVFPLMRLAISSENLPHCAKRVIRRSFRMFVALMKLTGVISCEVHGLERLRRSGSLIIANHPTLIDVVLLMSLVERADCIVKGALARNPFTSGPVRAAGYVFNDLGTGLVDDCIASVRRGNNLIIFPEGTRTPRSGVMHLQRGAARVAVHGSVDITPVRISCSPVFLRKGDAWFRVPHRRAHFVIEVCEVIAVAPYATDGNHAKASRQLNDRLTAFFSLERKSATARA